VPAEEILRSLAISHDLNQVETQTVPEAQTGSVEDARPHRPRRHKPTAESAPVQLMQVETSNAPVPTGGAQMEIAGTQERPHGPGRRRRSGSAAAPAEPLVQVETQPPHQA
jgi:hypothetical protein